MSSLMFMSGSRNGGITLTRSVSMSRLVTSMASIAAPFMASGSHPLDAGSTPSVNDKSTDLTSGDPGGRRLSKNAENNFEK